MAEVLTAFPRASAPKRFREGGMYDQFLDGQIWKLGPTDHTCANTHSFQTALLHRAKTMGLLAVTRVKGNCVYVQAIRAAQEA